MMITQTRFSGLCAISAALLVVVFVSGCNPTPTAAFEAAPSEGAAPLKVTFTDSSSTSRGELTAWQWDFDDGNTSAEQNPTHTFMTEGSYTVRLTVSNSANRSDEAQKTIQVGPPVQDEGEPGEGEPGEGEPGEGEPGEGEPGEGEPGEGEPGEGEPGEGEGEVEPLMELSLMGWVMTTTGNFEPGVTITVMDTGATTSTDVYGLYRFDVDEVSGSTVTVKFEKAGFATSSLLVDLVPDTVTTANVTLIPLAPPVALDADVGGEADDGDGNKLLVPAGAFIRRDTGEAVTGEVAVHITPIDLDDPASLAAFPGEFRALASDKSGDTVQLESFALADFTVTQDGVDLDLSASKTDPAFIELVLPASTSLEADDEIPLWWFDEDQGLWIETGVGDVVLNKVGQLVYRAEIPHLSWWNADVPVDRTDCFTGIAQDDAGNPLVNARVEANGIDYRGASYARTNELGEFCIDLKRGGEARLDLYLPSGTMVVDSVVITGADDGANCAGDDCTVLPGPLQANLDGCVSGEVRDPAGRPIAGATVYSSLGGSATTDAMGLFCMNTPTDIVGVFFVGGRPGIEVVTSEGSCAAGDCTEILLDFDYPEDGQHIGMISADFSGFGHEHYKEHRSVDFNSHAFFASGDYMPPIAPAYGCQVTHYDDFTWDEGGDMLDLLPDTAAVFLDPGAPGQLSVGEVAAPMQRLWDLEWFNEPFSFSMFMLDYWDSMRFNPGDTLTYAWPGGMTIGPFTASITAPTQATLIAPVLSYETEIDLSEPLVFEWTPIGVDFVAITLTSFTGNWTTNEFSSAAVHCIVEDTGSHTIPVDLLTQLPLSEGDEWGELTLSVAFTNTAQVEAPLTSGGSGILSLAAKYSIESWIYYDALARK